MSMSVVESPQQAGKGTKYEEIARQVLDLIESGTFGPGDRISSVRDMSHQMRVSVTTVLQAYRLLENKGHIEARPQSGYYVRARVAPKVAPPEMSRPRMRPAVVSLGQFLVRMMNDMRDTSLMHLGAAVPNPDLVPTEKLNRSIGSMSRRYRTLSNSYDMPPGCELLRVQIAQRSLVAGCTLSPQDIVTTCGAQEAISIALRATCKPGDIVALESPTFYGHLQSAEAMGLRVVEVPTCPTEGISIPAVRELISRHRISAFLVVTNFSNPLGCSLDEERKRELVELLARHEIPLIEDDIYGDLAWDGKRPSVAKTYDRKGLVLLCSSFSKTLAPGYRVGWIVPGRYQSEVTRLKVLTNIATPTLPQLAVADFLANGGYDHHLRRITRLYAHATTAMGDAVAESFPMGTRVTAPRGGFVLWVEAPKGVDTLKLYEGAIAAGFSFAPGVIFAAGDRYRNCLRLSASFWSPRARDCIRKLGRMVAEQMVG